ncbi:TonB-dependent receptor [candidate division WOR-3 bacterium]|nr:TonB-dependent receptor [candidate division WOR-3 bacterium]
MINRFVAMTILTLTLSNAGYAQASQGQRLPAGAGAGMLTGQVVDAELGTPLEYANAVLYERTSQAQVTGAMTDNGGNFRLIGVKPGTYTLKVSFMGYYPTEIDSIVVSSEDGMVSAGVISLERAVLMMEGVEVTSAKPGVEFQIDKKVINVDQHYTATSGTAVDVLQNVPSVTVDIEGNVSLRGSTNFTLLIDGRPTILEPSDALQQIPANTIENIEIITNPSVRYDPSGMGGIINVVMKKQRAQGTSGIVNLSVGLAERYSADFLASHRTDRFNVYLGANYNHDARPGTTTVENQTTANDTTSFVYSLGDMRWERTFYGARGGIDLYLGKHDMLSFSGRLMSRRMENTSERSYTEWTDPGDTQNIYVSKTDMKRGGDFYSINTDYAHNFSGQGHKLTASLAMNRRIGMDEESTTELFDGAGAITSGVLTRTKGPSTRLQANIDYVRPVIVTNQLSAGYQYSIRLALDSTELYEYDTDSATYVFWPQFSHNVEYDDRIHAFYGLYKGEWEKFGYQVGLRSEYSNRVVELVGEDESFTIDRWDYFPSAHVSYELPAEQEVMASHTRRIRRPRGRDLEPFLTWMDAYNVRIGNPALESEYINSYELGYQKHFGRNFLSLESYYRMTENKIERIRSVYDVNVLLHSVDNVGTDYAYGAEVMVDWDLFKWLNLNLTGDVYNYRIEGELYGEPFSRESFNWNARANGTVKLTGSTRFQMTGIYVSPSVSAQGRREGFIITNAAIRQDLWNRKLSATLQVRDIFGTAKHEFLSEGADFRSYTEFTRQSPVVSFTLTLNLNRFRQESERDENGEEYEEEVIF